MKNFLIQVAAFIIVLGVHFGLTVLGFYNSFGKYEELSFGTYLFSYKNALSHYCGLSYGLMGYFLVYLIRKYRETGKIRSVRTGVITSVIVFIAGYLAFGVNESTPMYNYFQDNLGYFYFKVQYLGLFITTVITVVTGSIIVWRTSKRFTR